MFCFCFSTRHEWNAFRQNFDGNSLPSNLKSNFIHSDIWKDITVSYVNWFDMLWTLKGWKCFSWIALYLCKDACGHLKCPNHYTDHKQWTIKLSHEQWYFAPIPTKPALYSSLCYLCYFYLLYLSPTVNLHRVNVFINSQHVSTYLCLLT